jgi:hypothetical protein
LLLITLLEEIPYVKLFRFLRTVVEKDRELVCSRKKKRKKKKQHKHPVQTRLLFTDPVFSSAYSYLYSSTTSEHAPDVGIVYLDIL